MFDRFYPELVEELTHPLAVALTKESPHYFKILDTLETMKYVIKPHAKMRMRERGIPEKVLGNALDNPSKIEYDLKGRALIKKLYRMNGKKRLLLIVGEFILDTLEIVTIIDTSKIKKYL